MIDVTSLSGLFDSIKAISLIELTYLYFLGFLLASIIKNILSLDTSQEVKGINFSKKFATIAVVLSLTILISNLVPQRLVHGNAFELAVYTILIVVISTLIFALLFKSIKFQRVYYCLYLIIIRWITLGLRNIKLKESIKYVDGSRVNLDSDITFMHLIHHLPGQLISLIVCIQAFKFDSIVLVTVLILIAVYLYSEYLVEFKQTVPQKFPWMRHGFGYKVFYWGRKVDFR